MVQRQPVNDDAGLVVPGREVQVTAGGVDGHPQNGPGPRARHAGVDEPRLCGAATGRDAPDDRLAAGVADVEVAVAVEHHEGGHVGGCRVRPGGNHGVDVLRAGSRVDPVDAAVHVGDVEPAGGVERHAGEAHGR